MKENYEASENMGKFFVKLYELKIFVKEKCEENIDDKVLKEIYDILNNLIKIENVKEK